MKGSDGAGPRELRARSGAVWVREGTKQEDFWRLDSGLAGREAGTRCRQRGVPGGKSEFRKASWSQLTERAGAKDLGFVVPLGPRGPNEGREQGVQLWRSEPQGDRPAMCPGCLEKAGGLPSRRPDPRPCQWCR